MTYLWQVTLHSCTMGLILYLWVHRVRLSSGPVRQRLLLLLLVLPMITAAVPGRASVEFAERLAWFNSARILAVPLPGGFQVLHALAALGVLIVVLTVVQEVLPALRSMSTGGVAAPEALTASVRARPGWQSCVVLVTPRPEVMVVTSGRPGRPRVVMSQGALDALTPEELDAVLTHEHAHWQGGRWWRTHALFAIRLVQCTNPVALWAFREYCIEEELACDRAAVAGRDPRRLARVLLRVYRETDRLDLAARSALRKRVDTLLDDRPAPPALPSFTIPLVAAVMTLVLPWLV